MKRLAFMILIASGVVAAAILVSDRRALANLRRENKELQVQLDQSLRREEEHRWLASQEDQAREKSILSPEQFRELLRLRGEVAVLRRERDEAARSSPKESRSSSETSPGKSSGPTSMPEQAYLPRESWTFAGYEDPNSAFQSCLWAWSRGDPKAVVASMSPGHRAGWGFRTDEQIAAAISNNMSATRGVQVLERKPVSEDAVLLILTADLEGGQQHKLGMRFRRVGAEWKFDREFKPD